MLQTKYRAKRIDSDEWVYGLPLPVKVDTGDKNKDFQYFLIVDKKSDSTCLYSLGEAIWKIVNQSNKDEDIEPFIAKVRPETVTRFTLQKTEKGEEIYENDVVKGDFIKGQFIFQEVIDQDFSSI